MEFFQTIRKISLIVFVACVVALTFLAVLSIWDVLADDVFEKSLQTFAVISFSMLLIVFVLAERDGSALRLLLGGKNSKFSVVRVIILLVILGWILPLFFNTLRYML